MSRHGSPTYLQQRRRWLTFVAVPLFLTVAAVIVTLVTLPANTERIAWSRPVPLSIPQDHGSYPGIILNAISCTSATACSAGGYIGTTRITEAIVVDESKGHWRRAQVVRGTATAAIANNTAVNAISCTSPGNCSAGGSLVNVEGFSRIELLGDQAPTTAFVVSEINGKWQKAHVVAGVVAPGIEEGATINYVSCPSDGNCAAAGEFASVPCADGWNSCVLPGSPYKEQFDKSFVVNEVDGVWGSPEWLGEANRGEYPRLTGLSCGAPGSCVAVGSSLSPSMDQEGFVAVETNGRWQPSVMFPGLALAGQTSSILNGVSCGSRGNCSAGGSYTDRRGDSHPFLVDEDSGTWRRAAPIKGSTSPALLSYTQVQSITCGSRNDCTAFGESLVGAGGLSYWIVRKHGGTWGSLRLVPGSAASTFDGFSGSEMACSSSQSCTIAGSYFTQGQSTRLYALSEVKGHFTRLVSLPGVAPLHLAPTAGSVMALSCGSNENCVALEEFVSNGNESPYFEHEFVR